MTGSYQSFVPEHERTLGPRRLATAEQQDRQIDQLISEMFPPGWRRNISSEADPGIIDLSGVNVTDEHIKFLTNITSEMYPAELAQSPLLRGIIAVGTPIDRAIEASAEASTNPDLQHVRRASGDLALGVAVGFALREVAFSEVVT